MQTAEFRESKINISKKALRSLIKLNLSTSDEDCRFLLSKNPGPEDLIIIITHNITYRIQAWDLLKKGSPTFSQLERVVIYCSDIRKEAFELIMNKKPNKKVLLKLIEVEEIDLQIWEKLKKKPLTREDIILIQYWTNNSNIKSELTGYYTS